MEVPVFLGLAAALLTAVCQSAADIGTKAATRRVEDSIVLATQWCVAGVLLTAACVVAWPQLLRDPVAALGALTRDDFGLLVAAGGALNAVAYYFFVRAFRLADASLVAPIVLTTPALLLVTSPIMVGEHVPPLGAFGVLLCVAGAVVLAMSEPGATKRASLSAFVRDPGARAMLATASIWSVTANIDKLGVRASSPLLWIAALSDAIALLSIAALLLGGGSRPASWRALAPALAAGIANALGNGVQMFALTVLPVPYVIAVKRMSALFTVGAAAVMLKEDIRGRLLGAAIMLAGAGVVAFAQR